MKKEIQGYEGIYQIDINGNIYSRNLPEGRVMKHGMMTSGYKSVRLKKNKKGKTFSIHRLIAISFIENPNNFPQVNHIDGNKLNNNIENLEWCTQSYNNQHAYDTGLKTYRPLHYKGKFGKDHNRSKAVCCVETQVIFGSYSEASRYYKVNVTSIFNSVKFGTQIKKIKKTFKDVK